MKKYNLNSVFNIFALVLFVVLIVFPAELFAWGRDGHKIVARIAESHLSEKTKKAILDQKLLDVDSTCKSKKLLTDKLACISNWADDVRDNIFPKSYNWHFVNISLKESDYIETRDCKEHAEKGTCTILALDSLNRFLDKKTNTFSVGTWKPKISDFERGHSLLFIVHLIGDMHQPLHTVKEGSGGNSLKVTFFRFACKKQANKCVENQPSLHKVWDTNIISGMLKNAQMSEKEFAEKLSSEITTSEKIEFEAKGPIDWLLEAHQIAINNSYELPPKTKEKDGKYYSKISNKYFEQNSLLIEKQLQRAGIRLAKILNDIFDS